MWYDVYIYNNNIYIHLFIYSISLSLSIWPNQSQANYQSLSKSPRHNFCAPWNRARSSFSVWSTSMILSRKRYSVAGNALECLKIGWRFLGIKKKICVSSSLHSILVEGNISEAFLLCLVVNMMVFCQISHQSIDLQDFGCRKWCAPPVPAL